MRSRSKTLPVPLIGYRHFVDGTTRPIYEDPLGKQYVLYDDDSRAYGAWMIPEESAAHPSSWRQGPMPRGRPPDTKRLRQMTLLRQRGLTFQQIAKRLGCSRQCVQQTLARFDVKVRCFPICCRECNAFITEQRAVANRNGPVFCLGCLPTDATLGQRIKAHRLTAGLTHAALSKKTGIDGGQLSEYERDEVEPKWRNLSKLIRVFGVALVDVSRARSNEPPEKRK